MRFKVGERVRVIEEFNENEVIAPNIGQIGKILETRAEGLKLEFKSEAFRLRIWLFETDKVKAVIDNAVKILFMCFSVKCNMCPKNTFPLPPHLLRRYDGYRLRRNLIN